MLIRAVLLVAALALVAAACSSDGVPQGVASVTDLGTGTTAPGATSTSAPADEPPDTEQALLELAACMRDEGIDMDDPQIGSDGNFRLGPLIRQASNADPDEIRAAMDACSKYIEGVTLGFRDFDLTEFQDQLLDFAGCMREAGFDMPDPDFSSFGLGNNIGRGSGPFGEIDPSDPTFEMALDACQDILSFGRFGGAGGGAGRGGRG